MTTIPARFSPTGGYLKLVRQFALRPIRDDAEYKAALHVVEHLAVRGENDLDDGEMDYLSALDQFISAYDRDALGLRSKRGTPRQRLESLLKDSNTTPVALAKILDCSHTLVSLLLAGKRELSKASIQKLAAYYRLDAGFFM